MTTTFLDRVTAVVGSDCVLRDLANLKRCAIDQWAISQLRAWGGREVPLPLAVVRPRDVRTAQQVVALARTYGVAIVPRGLGSGVCGGASADAAALVLDLSALNRVRGIDEVNLLGSFDAGISGIDAENATAAMGLTIGHWPQSIAISSVGGWISTRASGQFSTANGNIEDIVYALDVVLPNGDLITVGKAPRAAAGPDLRHIFIGAEGIMGVVTGVTLALRRLPEHRAYSAYFAPDMDAGFEAQRRIVQADWRPPVMRQYDGREVKRNFFDYARGALPVLIMAHEGPRARVDVELNEVHQIAISAGLQPADDAITRSWMERRNHVPAWRDLFEMGLVADTVEISGNWRDIGSIYSDVVAALNKIPGVINASAHSSHVYRTGLNLYFSFAARIDDVVKREEAYFACWRAVMEATAARGGGIAHHHGAGRLRKPYLEYDLGAGGITLLRTIKSALDPDLILNPGNLIPDA